MSNERARAISVTNHYFMLVDGMIPGFEDHLAKNVVLKWFGKEIKGKENVIAFIASDRTESFHTFHDIMPISDIIIEQRQSNRSRESVDQNAKCETHTSYCSRETEMSTNYENAIDSNRENNENDATSVLKNDCTFNIEEHACKLKIMTDCDNVNVNDNINANIDANQNEINATAITKMDAQSNDFNKNDLRNLFEPEITSQAIVEKIQNINRAELKEEMAPTVRAINRESDQGDEPVIVEADTTRYLEANGTIKFLRTNIQKDFPFLYYSSKLALKRKNWKRKCKLQIAYSLLIDNKSPKIVKKCMQENIPPASHLNPSTENTYKMQKNKLPSVEEIIQVNTKKIRNTYLDDYLTSLPSSEYREKFLKDFETEMHKKFNVQSCVRYVGNKLILDYPNKKPPLNVMYEIHMIVYTKVE